MRNARNRSACLVVTSSVIRVIDPSAFLILSRCATKFREENLFARKGTYARSKLSTLDCELLAQTMLTHATPMFASSTSSGFSVDVVNAQNLECAGRKG